MDNWSVFSKLGFNFFIQSYEQKNLNYKSLYTKVL